MNFEDETAFFPDTKNSRSRTVPVQRFTMDLLKLLPRSDERVFPLSDGEFEGAWKRIAKRAGLRERDRTDKKKCLNDFHGHDLRHEGLSRISEVGHATNPNFSVFDLQAISGHLDIASLARHINPKPKLLTKRVNRLRAFRARYPPSGEIPASAKEALSRSSGSPSGIVIAFPGVSPRRNQASRAASPVVQPPYPGSAPLTKL